MPFSSGFKADGRRSRRHFLVWTLLPLVSWPNAADFVARQGIAGAVFLDASAQNIEAEGNHTEAVCEEIVAFAKSRWPSAKEFAWIVNPVHLQTVPRLVSGAESVLPACLADFQLQAHAHVFVRH